MLKKIVLLILPLCLIAGYCIAQEEAEEEKMAPEKNPIVKIETNHGDIYLEVFLIETPIHAQNFLTKVQEGKYDSLIFHRVVKGFVVQGGDPTGTGMGSMGTERLPDEKSPFPQVAGTVAMARSPQGASNCQFYINLKDNTFLDEQKFSSFAKVVHGMDVVNTIGKVETVKEKPVEPVIMKKLTVVESLPEE
ncbi:MAG: peptidylprolyl isomerase [Candidatus Zixiibacteriota bacterium]|nr:MAG: peptidylprolyl isomerase [candidate division Zixibacteria bacterium]